MIAVIRKGSDFCHAAKYLFGPGERGEHVDCLRAAPQDRPLDDAARAAVAGESSRRWDWPGIGQHLTGRRTRLATHI